MSKNYFNKFLRIILFFIAQSVLTSLIFAVSQSYDDVQASSQLNLTPVADAMAREGFEKNYGSWNDMTVGRSWNLGNYFSNSYAYIKFDLSMLSSQSIIESAYLEVYQYVRSDYASGDYLVNVAKVNQDWSEMNVNWNNKPDFSGIYAQSWISGGAGQWFNPPQKYTFDVTNLVREWVQGISNYGLVLYKDQGNVGGFWCTRNYNNSTCFESSQPRLVVNYSANHAPNIPNPTSPTNKAEFGGDSSCQGYEITMKVKDLGDPDGNFDGTWFYYKRLKDRDWEISPKRDGQKTAQFTKFLPDGIWEWKTRSKDQMDVWSDYSAIYTFIIDTTPPSSPEVIGEPEFSQGNQNTVRSTLSFDSLLKEVKYKFGVFEGENCNTYFYEGDWQESQEFTIADLYHDATYCYQVKSKDKLGNENDWSEFVKSRQDSILPAILNAQVSEEVISPNADGRFDSTELSFEVFDEHFDHWEATILDLYDVTIKSFRGTSLSDLVIWDGTDNSGNIVLDGLYTFKLRAFDKAGNFSPDSDVLVVVDNTPATVNISKPIDGAWLNTDTVFISGITEETALLSINNRLLFVDHYGIFEVEEQLSLGENVFTFMAMDSAGNISTQSLKVNKEIDVPKLEVTAPIGLINDRTPNINLKLSDEYNEIFQSGIDSQSINLSLLEGSNNELVLVSDGKNIQTQLGHIETSCLNVEIEGSFECIYSYFFDNPLQPDGDYTIKSTVRDVAGNQSDIFKELFTLDSHTYLQIETPLQGELMNHSKVTIRGQAESNSRLNVTGSETEIIININPDQQGIYNCHPVESRFGIGWEGVKEVCDFEIEEFQLRANQVNDIYVKNNISLELIDNAKNIAGVELNVEVNLYAVNLSIEGNNEYISPNGDGRQDGIDFTLKVYNRDSQEEDVQVEVWEIHIKDIGEDIVALLSGSDGLPPNYYFNGKDSNGSWLSDGEYTYSLWIRTTDGVEFGTDPVKFYVKTKVDGEVVITNPKNHTVTAKGVINVQGQAPLDTVVRLCVDLIGIDGDCNDEQVLEVNEYGFFTGIVPLTTKESYLWAYAIDFSGNETSKSNVVKVILDFSDPLLSVRALPSLTGVDQEVILRSLVTQYTEYVDISFADYSNLSELPDGSLDRYKIGRVDGFGRGCTQNECTWDYLWTTPDVSGGIYEIEFVGRKGETEKTMSIGIRIDGTIPVVPTITKLIKEDLLVDLKKFREDYYTNDEKLIINGIAEPLSYVHILVDGVEVYVCKADPTGKWKANIKLPFISSYRKYEISSVSSDNVNNKSEISFPVNVVLDKIAPEFRNITTSNSFHQSGTAADIFIQSNEALTYVTVIRQDSARFHLLGDNSRQNYLGGFVIESEADEGNYSIDINIEDYAGNAANGEFTYIIDNTKPNFSDIDISEWGKYNGIYAKHELPAKGRILPEYVIRGRELEIKGKAEENSKVEIWLSSYEIDEILVGSDNCEGKTLAYTGVYYPLCDWSFNLNIGAFEQGYIIQTKVQDRAGNKSSISKGELLYYDKTAPGKPNEVRSADYWDDDGFGNITNKYSVLLKGEAERLSDIELWVTNPKGIEDYCTFQNEPRSIWQENVNFGKNSGPQEDGLYMIKVKSTDAPGNNSEILTYEVERDTVPPAKPEVFFNGNPAQRKLSLEIKGEKYSKVKVHIYRSGIDLGEQEYKIDENRQLKLSSFTSWMWGAEYRVDVQLQDRARNFSETVTGIYHTPTWAIGDVEGEVSENPWGDRYGSSLSDVNLDISISSDENYNINGVFIPTPELTTVYTTEDGLVEVYGVAIPKGHSLTADIKREYKTYNEAVKECDVGYFIDNGERRCIEEKMGIERLSSWIWEMDKQCFFVPWCLENKKTTWREVKEYRGNRFQVEHVMISFHKDNGEDTEVGHIWNDDLSGRFQKVFTLNSELNVNDYVKARTNIFGQFEFQGVIIDYRGRNRQEAQWNLGLRSEYSNLKSCT
ncbi:DNRLRE domain-containing protein [Candidatus Dojkabacteria bacterium]|nr:DNRLRE domain-containing protein [Candidatus Dojkabacteria bacterium]